jgi:UPF0755 protein
MKKKIYIVLILIVSIVLSIIVVANYVSNELNSRAGFANEIIIEIPRNTSIAELISIMNEENLFKPSWIYKNYFKLYAFVYSKHIVAGTFKFTAPLTNRDIVNSFLSGANLYIIKVTYPEGITINKFAEITENKLNLPQIEFLEYLNSKTTLTKFGIEENSAEGYLMPATYQFYFNAKVETIVNMLLSTQKKLWDKKFKKLAQQKRWSKHKVLTLASIIEAETPVVDERAIVSGVYHNRLDKGMLLQADPTVQYAVGGKSRLLYRDLKVNSPYNTYRYLGLPPGPINSPSETAISAALNPAQHDYYYFVAVGDGSNKHHFARNIDEHGKYVSRYRRNLRIKK